MHICLISLTSEQLIMLKDTTLHSILLEEHISIIHFYSVLVI